MKKITKQLTVLFSFLFLTSFYAQEFAVSGKIIDSDNLTVAYANVLLTTTEGEIYKGTSSNESGTFSIEQVQAGTYILNISFLGYETFTKEIQVSSNLKLDTIVLTESAEALGEIEIVAQRPVFKKEQDRLVFTIENTTLTEGNVWEVLKGTPGILMINDEITVKNSSNIIYLINDKRVYLDQNELQQLLTGTNAASVKAIEVITNPPAKYDASGGAVINIKMSKNLITGYNGNLYTNYTQGIYPRAAAGTSHFYKTQKWNFFLGYAFDYRKINRKNNEEVTFIENEAIVGKWNTPIDRNTKSQSHTINANIDYEIDEKNTLSFSTNASFTPYWKRLTKSNTQATDSTFNSVNHTDRENKNIAFNLGYTHTAENGNTFAANAHHTAYTFDGFQDLETDYFDTQNTLTRSNLFNSRSLQEVAIFSGQLDYAIQAKDNQQIEFGAKVANIASDNDFTQISLNNGNQTLDIDNSGIFKYSETTYAGYISYKKSWETWDFSLGFRGEHTSAKGNLVNQEVNTFDYFKLFPTLSLSHTFNENHSLGVTYNKRIERPAYTNLNPFQFYLNDNAYVVGNPNLQPTISQLVTLSYTLNQEYTFEVYYRHEENTMSEQTFQDNENNKIKYVASNLKQDVDYGFDFFTYKSITDFWSVYVVNSIFKMNSQFFAVENDNRILENERWSMYSNIINYFSLSATTSAELSALYISPTVHGSSNISSRAQIDLSLKKSFAKGKWVASLTASDIFNTTGFEVSNNYLDQRNKYQTTFDNQWIRVGLRYNFGNTKLETNQRSSSESERERIKERD
ncbi:MAG TPA: outer membrane beta-barrel family protein [Flavobacteriaceae bacterium]|nr:outer membrane beta-barrel family protein [Flavobacteriaceae bacterium]